MADDTIDIEVKGEMLHIQVRNLIGKESKDKKVLDIEQLMLKLDIPLKAAAKGKSDAAGGKSDEVRLKALENIRARAKEIVTKVRNEANERIKDLAGEITKQLAKDQQDDKDAYKTASKLVSETAEKLEDMVNGIPPSLREAAKEEMKKCRDAFCNDKLTCVGSWGFRSGNRGIRMRPGVFKHVGKDDSGDAELRAALKAAKGGGYKFVLVDSGPGGLVVRKSVGGSTDKLAKEQAGGTGNVLHGEIKHESGRYLFLLDKSCSASKGDRLARRIRDIVKERCNKSIKVWVADDDWEDTDDEAEAKAAAKSGGGEAKT
jgi:hypothetical protein